MPTIIPITPEQDWIRSLANLPRWHPPLVPTVVLAPHPDDEVLGAGGLIAHLRAHQVPVTVVAITDGEGAYADTEQLDRLRVPEQTEALARLGVPETSILRLGIPDRFVSDHESTLVQVLSDLLNPGMQLIAPWQGDFHPDHEAAGRAAERVASCRSISLLSYFFWTWHRGTPATIQDLSLVAFPLSTPEADAKLHALRAHASQLAHPDGQPILSPRLLEPAQRSFEVYIQS